MKQLLLVVISFFVSISIYAQEGITIVMQNDNGIYKIPCLVNGAKMKFIFDTGATTVSLSSSMANYLLENDYISKDDIVGFGKSTVADGTIIEHTKILLKDIEISGLHLRNVEATVLKSLSAPLLLGQTAIQKLGRIELDGNILRIKDADNNMGDTDEYVKNLINKADEYRKMKLYSKACEYYSEAHSLKGLSDYGKYIYATCCLNNEDNLTAFNIINEITNFKKFEEDSINIYTTLGLIYWGNKKYNDAIAYYKLSFDKFTNDWESRAYDANSIAAIYSVIGDHEKSMKHCQLALYCLEKHYNLEKDYLWNDCLGKLKKGQKSYRNSIIDRWVYYLVMECQDSGAWSTNDVLHTLCRLARNNNYEAIKRCNEAGLDINLW